MNKVALEERVRNIERELKIIKISLRQEPDFDIDKLVKEGLSEYRSGKTKKIRSLAELK